MGKQDLLRAAEHLVAAADYLKHATGSAALNTSPDTVEYFDEAVSLGQETADHIAIKHPKLSDHLEKLRAELDKLASSITRQAE